MYIEAWCPMHIGGNDSLNWLISLKLSITWGHTDRNIILILLELQVAFAWH